MEKDECINTYEVTIITHPETHSEGALFLRYRVRAVALWEPNEGQDFFRFMTNGDVVATAPCNGCVIRLIEP